MTQAEQALWRAFRDRKNEGLKFRRQHPVGPFVLDFCCPTRRLVIELDGAVHNDQVEEDGARSRLLTDAGYHILRFRNEQIETDLDQVVAAIRRAALARPEVPTMPTRWASSSPSPGARERGPGGEGT